MPCTSSYCELRGFWEFDKFECNDKLHVYVIMIVLQKSQLLEATLVSEVCKHKYVFSYRTFGYLCGNIIYGNYASSCECA